MSIEQLDNGQPAVQDRGLLVAATIAFLALLGAYVFLSKDDPDPEGVLRLVLTLAGIFGLGTYNRVKHKETERKLDAQNVALARITTQTNGVLDDRIEQGVVKAMVATGLVTEAAARASAAKQRSDAGR